MHLFRVQLFFSLSGYPYVLALYHSLDRSARVPTVLAVVGEAVLSAHIMIALWEQVRRMSDEQRACRRTLQQTDLHVVLYVLYCLFLTLTRAL